MVSEFGIFLPFRARGVARFTQSSHPKAAAISTRPAASNRMKRSMLAESAAWPAGSPKRSYDSPARPMACCTSTMTATARKRSGLAMTAG